MQRYTTEVPMPGDETRRTGLGKDSHSVNKRCIAQSPRGHNMIALVSIHEVP